MGDPVSSDDIQIESVDVVNHLDNVWVHFHLAGELPEQSGETITVQAAARDGSTHLVGVTLNHPHPSELFVAEDDAEREVVSVGTEHVSESVLTVAFPADAFSGLGDDPTFTVRVERDDDGRDIDAPVTLTDSPRS